MAEENNFFGQSSLHQNTEYFVMNTNNPFHEGELAVQNKLGVSDTARMNAKVVSNRIPGGALSFISQQSMVIFGSIDKKDMIWSSAIFGEPGFISPTDESALEIDTSKLGMSSYDPLWKNIAHNNHIGMLIIELVSRRRLRINGRIEKLSETKYKILVDQAYPNCPKYIQRRHISRVYQLNKKSIEVSTNGKKLSKYQMELISSADTFFVASAHEDHNVDASHRGGNPGFIQVISDKVICIPDYSGNSMFNTLGNFQSNPQAGLVFIDFYNKKFLQLTGEVKILWKIEGNEKETGGTCRYWKIKIDSWIESHIPFGIEWEYLDSSPFNPITVNQKPNELMLTVRKIKQESPHIKSFYLTDKNGNYLPGIEAGSHLKLKLGVGNHSMVRHYSILSNPGERTHYQIAVLEEPNSRGGSKFMHHQVQEGDELHCEIAVNNFQLNEKAKHTILIAGGIGITPIYSMLQKLTKDKQSLNLHYTAKYQSDFIFSDNIKVLADGDCQFYASREGGLRLNLDAILKTPKNETHIYVCGPLRLINSAREISEKNGWNPDQIHFESFGSAPDENNKEVKLHLAISELFLTVPADISILDYLLEKNIEIPHQCKRGECGLCTTKVLAGTPEHKDLCLDKDTQKTSMCLCVSRAKSKSLTLDL